MLLYENFPFEFTLTRNVALISVRDGHELLCIVPGRPNLSDRIYKISATNFVAKMSAEI